MRRWVWLGWALALPSCAGDYSLPPTPCDDLCHATQGPSCPESYEPAGCVASCEASSLDAEDCRPYLDAVVTCFQRTPGALEQQCIGYGYYDDTHLPPCTLERQLLAGCVGLIIQSRGQP